MLLSFLYRICHCGAHWDSGKQLLLLLYLFLGQQSCPKYNISSKTSALNLNCCKKCSIPPVPARQKKLFLYFIQQSVQIGRKLSIQVVFHTTFCLIPFAAVPTSSRQPPLNLPNPAAAPFLDTHSFSQFPSHTFLSSNPRLALTYLSLNVRPISFIPLFLVTPNNLWHPDVSSAGFSVNSSR